MHLNRCRPLRGRGERGSGVITPSHIGGYFPWLQLTPLAPLRQRIIEDMAARKLGPHSQRSHIESRKRFAAFLKRP